MPGQMKCARRVLLALLVILFSGCTGQAQVGAAPAVPEPSPQTKPEKATAKMAQNESVKPTEERGKTKVAAVNPAVAHARALVAASIDTNGAVVPEACDGLEKYILKLHTELKGADEHFWEKSPVLGLLQDDDPAMRSALYRVLPHVYPRMPDQFGLIAALNAARAQSRHWDVIWNVPDVQEACAGIELNEIVSRINADPKSAGAAIQGKALQILALGEAARISLRQVANSLDPTVDILLAEQEARLREQTEFSQQLRRLNWDQMRFGGIHAQGREFRPSDQLKELRAVAEQTRELGVELGAASDMLLVLEEKIRSGRNETMLSEAREYLPSPEKFPQTLAANDVAVANALMLAGETLVDADQKPAVAARLLFDSIRVSRGLKPERSKWLTIRTLRYLALALDALAAKEAENIYAGLIEQLEKDFANDRSDEKAGQWLFIVLADAGTSSWNHAKASDAKLRNQKRVDVGEVLYGPQSPAVGEALSDLALALSEIGETKEAIIAASRATELLSSDESREAKYVDCIAKLAGYLQKDQRSSEAEELLRKRLAEIEAKHGENHLLTITLLERLGNCLTKLGRLEESEKALRTALTKLQESGKADHSRAAWCHESLGYLARAKGASSQADHQRAYQIRLELYGDEHPLTLRSKKNAAIQ